MEQATIVTLLKNSGLKVIGIDSHFVYFEDPSCIFSAFDKILNYAWIAVVVLTAIMLFGWAALYIKNGVKIDSLFKNARALILIFCTLSVVKPAVNFIYGDNLFGQQCDIIQVSLSEVNELLEQRNKNFAESDAAILSESFVVIDSAYETFDPEWDQDFSLNFSEPEFSNSSFEKSKIRNISNRGSLAKSSNSIIYVNRRGEHIKHVGGTAAWRNNNPGNIINSDFAIRHGAVSVNGRFAVFPDAETGFNAAVSLLQTPTYNNLSIIQAIRKWAPSSDGNNPEHYARRVSNLTGLPIHTRINNLNQNDLRKVVRAIQVVEGWESGIEQKLQKDQ